MALRKREEKRGRRVQTYLRLSILDRLRHFADFRQVTEYQALAELIERGLMCFEREAGGEASNTEGLGRLSGTVEGGVSEPSARDAGEVFNRFTDQKLRRRYFKR